MKVSKPSDLPMQNTKRDRESEEDTLVAIFFRNEEGQHTGYLVCERSQVTDDELVQIKMLPDVKNMNGSELVRSLELNGVLALSTLYLKLDRLAPNRRPMKFRYEEDLDDPILPISCLISAWC